MNKTKIEYADYSWNYLTGCVEKSQRPGCLNCWARKMAETRLRGQFGYRQDDPFKLTVHQDELNEPVRIKKPSTILVNFMGDMFHDCNYHTLTGLDNLIQIANNVEIHKYLVLTKFIDNAIQLFNRTTQRPLYDNIWFGITCENQNVFNRDAPKLEQIPIENKWISFEPMLNPIEIDRGQDKYFDWAVIGGESGTSARMCKLSWIFSLMIDCTTRSIPVFIKQLGACFKDDLQYWYQSDQDLIDSLPKLRPF